MKKKANYHEGGGGTLPFPGLSVMCLSLNTKHKLLLKEGISTQSKSMSTWLGPATLLGVAETGKITTVYAESTSSLLTPLYLMSYSRILYLPPPPIL